MTRICKAGVAVVLVLGSALPVAAQGQSPTPPAGARSWDDYGLDEALPAKPGTTTPKDKAPAGTENAAQAGGGAVPWKVAIQAGLVAAGSVMAAEMCVAPLAGVPVVGVVFALTRLAAPVLAPAAGWALVSYRHKVRAPLMLWFAAAAAQVGTAVCCLPPAVVLAWTPLGPLVGLGRVVTEAAVSGLMTTLLVAKFGRLKTPGEPQWTFDLASVPPAPEDDQAAPAPAAPDPAAAPDQRSSSPAAVQDAPGAAPPAGDKPSSSPVLDQPDSAAGQP